MDGGVGGGAYSITDGGVEPDDLKLRLGVRDEVRNLKRRELDIIGC